MKGLGLAAFGRLQPILFSKPNSTAQNPVQAMILESLLPLIETRLRSYLGELDFQTHWPWPNPDAGHVRVRGRELGTWGWPTRRTLDLRIRPSADFVAHAAVPTAVRQAVAHIGRWQFDGAEQVAMTNFWVLTLPATGDTLRCVVLPPTVLLALLRRANRPGQLILYFTNAGECYISPSLQTRLDGLHKAAGPHVRTSGAGLSAYVNGWHQVVEPPFHPHFWF